MSKVYNFQKFVVDGVDDTKNPTTIVMNTDHVVEARYLEESQMGTVTISGVVSAQAAVGEVVTVKITKPDATIVTLTDATDASRAYNVSYTDVAESYSAVASIPASSDANNNYSAATSPSFPFTIAKTNVTRTIAINVV